MLGDFVEKMAEPAPGSFEKPRRIGVISTAGDRRDDDMRDLGSTAAPYFDSILVREDRNLRRRAPGETATLIAEGVRAQMDAGARCRDLEVVLDEIDATRRALDKANPGDLVVVCVDQTSAVWAELQARSHRAVAAAADPDARP
jgi:cyanophycin synthetase